MGSPPAPRWRRLMLGAVLALGACASAHARDDFSDFSELNLESLLNQVVTTASKHAQKASESPVSTVVITAAEIAAGGARTIPEILRDVPGLDVMLTNASGYDVSARGMNKPGSNSMLVLIDGRSAYADFYGVTLWEFLPVSLAEIKSIEVIMGPGSAFYGANAFAGVINIITYAPSELAGGRLDVAVAQPGGSLASAYQSVQRGGWAGRVVAGSSRPYDTEHATAEGGTVRLTARGEHRFADDSRLRFSAANTNGAMDLVPSSAAVRLDGQTQHCHAEYRRGGLSARWFWNHTALDAIPLTTSVVTDLSVLDADVTDVELQHVLASSDRHLLQWGASYRYKSVDWTLQRQVYQQDVYSAFVYDEWRARRNLLLSFGVRHDDHPLVGGHTAPRGGVVFRPGEHHTLRASYSVAYRDPSYLENYWYLELAGPFGTTQLVRGDLDLASEEIRAVEVGYQGLVDDDLMVTANLFRNDVDKLISLAILSEIPVPPAPVSGIPAEIAFANKHHYIMEGGELVVDATPLPWLDLRGFWAYVWAENASSGEIYREAPRHTASLTACLFPDAARSLYATARYRSETTWAYGTLTGGFSYHGFGDEHLTVDLRLVSRARPGRARAVLGLENVFDKRYRDNMLAMEQERRLVASVGWEF